MRPAKAAEAALSLQKDAAPPTSAAILRSFSRSSCTAGRIPIFLVLAPECGYSLRKTKPKSGRFIPLG